jgi:hypothetical protein
VTVGNDSDADRARAAQGAAAWDAWLRSALDAERTFTLTLVGEFVGDELRACRRAYDKLIDQQRRTFEAELKAATSELRSRVVEIASEMRSQLAAARREIDVELRAQSQTIRFEAIDRIQRLTEKLQAAIGERQAPIIDAEAERQRRPN